MNRTAFVSLSRAAVKGFVRDRAALFWTLAFPLMFLVIFGLLFQGAGTSRTKVAAVGDGDVIRSLRSSDVLELVDYDKATAEKKVRKGDLPALIEQDGTMVTVRFSGGDQARSGTVIGIVQGVVSQANLQATGQPPRFSVTASRIEDESLKPIQFLTPGLLSWAISMGAVFGSALTLVTWRTNQVMRRLRLAPVSPLTILTTRLFVAVMIGLVQLVVFLAVASTPAFGLKLSGQWWLAAPLVVLGALAFFSIGMLVGSFSKTVESASGIANMIVLPMAFLSGSFFPLNESPGWVQGLAQVMPMHHLNKGMTDVMVRGEGISALGLPAVVLLGFTLVVGSIAVRTFRWDSA